MIDIQSALRYSEKMKGAYPYDVPTSGPYITGGARNFIRKAQSGQGTFTTFFISVPHLCDANTCILITYILFCLSLCNFRFWLGLRTSLCSSWYLAEHWTGCV